MRVTVFDGVLLLSRCCDAVIAVVVQARMAGVVSENDSLKGAVQEKAVLSSEVSELQQSVAVLTSRCSALTSELASTRDVTSETDSKVTSLTQRLRDANDQLEQASKRCCRGFYRTLSSCLLSPCILVLFLQ